MLDTEWSPSLFTHYDNPDHDFAFIFSRHFFWFTDLSESTDILKQNLHRVTLGLIENKIS